VKTATIRDPALGQLTSKTAGANTFASADVEQPWPALTLAAIGVFRPGAGWLGRKATDPVVSLELAIDGDRNVVEVAFIDASRSTVTITRR
jgi:hypothetical protein